MAKKQSLLYLFFSKIVRFFIAAYTLFLGRCCLLHNRCAAVWCSLLMLLCVLLWGLLLFCCTVGLLQHYMFLCGAAAVLYVVLQACCCLLHWRAAVICLYGVQVGLAVADDVCSYIRQLYCVPT
jgi:hypothetical protein